MHLIDYSGDFDPGRNQAIRIRSRVSDILRADWPQRTPAFAST